MITDVTEATFDRDVLERSRKVAVVVDFWAEWCGPCRQLTPALEAAAGSREGQVDLAKVDTDANQGLARAFGIQGIPAVKAFRNGEVVDEFVGAQPPAGVERFFDGLIPSEADQLVDAGDEASLRRAIELQPARPDARLALGRLLHERDEDDEALEVLDGAPGDFGAEALSARIRLERSPELDLSEAFQALDAGDRERAVDRLLEAIGSADGARDDVRRLIVGILDELGVGHPAARDARRRLAAALY